MWGVSVTGGQAGKRAGRLSWDGEMDAYRQTGLKRHCTCHLGVWSVVVAGAGAAAAVAGAVPAEGGSKAAGPGGEQVTADGPAAAGLHGRSAALAAVAAGADAAVVGQDMEPEPKLDCERKSQVGRH